MKKNDPALYRRLSEPFKSADEANAAVAAFMEDVRAAREKHGIADTVTVVGINVLYPSGVEGSGMSYGSNGDPLKTGCLLAYALGVEQAESRENMNRLMAGNGK